MEQSLLYAVEGNPCTSVPPVAAAVEGSRNSVHSVLHREVLHQYHSQRSQGLLPTDHLTVVSQPRCNARWYLNQCAQNTNFPSYVLFTDEAYFTWDDVFYKTMRIVSSRKLPRTDTACFPTSLFCECLGWNGRRILSPVLPVAMTSDISKLCQLFGTSSARHTSPSTTKLCDETCGFNMMGASPLWKMCSNTFEYVVLLTMDWA